MVIWAPGGTVMGWPKFMFAIVMVAAPADAGAFVASLPLAVAVSVPDLLPYVLLLDPPHAVASAATTHMAAQNKPNPFIVTTLESTPGNATINNPNWFN